MFKSSVTPKKTVLIVGGGFGGLIAIQSLDNNFNVILVDRKSFFEYTPNYPLALVDPNFIDGMTLSLQDFAKTHKCQFIQGTLLQLFKDKAQIKQNDQQTLDISFDYCIISTGSSYASSIKPEKEIVTIEQRKEQIKQQIENLSRFKKVLVIGGGPVGVEMAGILSEQFKNLKVHLWNRSPELLSLQPQKAKTQVDEMLRKQGVNIVYNKEVTLLPVQEFDQIFDCRGNIYAPSFMIDEFQQYINPQGLIVVDEYCRLKNHQNIICIGDAALTPNNECKMSYNAAIQGQYAAENIISIDKKKNSLKKLEGDANMFLILINQKTSIQCFGDSVSIKSTDTKISYQNKTIKSLKGSFFYSLIASLSRRLIVMISGCKKRKQPEQNKNNQNIP